MEIELSTSEFIQRKPQVFECAIGGADKGLVGGSNSSIPHECESIAVFTNSTQEFLMRLGVVDWGWCKKIDFGEHGMQEVAQIILAANLEQPDPTQKPITYKHTIG